MSTVPPQTLQAPIPYDPAYEREAQDEAGIARALARSLRRQHRVFACDRAGSLHAESHGLMRGELQVYGDLPPSLAQGLFAAPARYPLVMRLSTIPGDGLVDHASIARGMALKVFGVEGERLPAPGARGAHTQDFLLVNDPANPPQSHLLGDTYYGQTPYLYGRYMAKWSVVPVSPALVALRDAPLDTDAGRDALRDAVVRFFTAHDGEWELRVQQCTNLQTMPIEDARRAWPEAQSPYRSVARVRILHQPAWSAAHSPSRDELLYFDPWQGLAAHRPLGAVNRIRRRAGEIAGEFPQESRRRHGRPAAVAGATAGMGELAA